MKYNIKVLDKGDLGTDWVGYKLKIKNFFSYTNDIIYFIVNKENPKNNFFNDIFDTNAGDTKNYQILLNRLINMTDRESNSVDILKHEIFETIKKWEFDKKLTSKGKELGDLYNNL
jgi:hypothetical protein